MSSQGHTDAAATRRRERMARRIRAVRFTCLVLTVGWFASLAYDVWADRHPSFEAHHLPAGFTVWKFQVATATSAVIAILIWLERRWRTILKGSHDHA